MAMSSGKSSSMAALLLLVAVVAGTCASGAQAQFDIINSCSIPIRIHNTKIGDFTVDPFGSIHFNSPPGAVFNPHSPITITLELTVIPPIKIPEGTVNELVELGTALRKVGISCDQHTPCITLDVTSNGPARDRELGPFCPRN